MGWVMTTSDLVLGGAALGFLVLAVHFGELLALGRAGREFAEWVLEHFGLLRPKAEVIDLADLFESRRIRRELEQLRLGPGDPEPPRSA